MSLALIVLVLSRRGEFTRLHAVQGAESKLLITQSDGGNSAGIPQDTDDDIVNTTTIVDFNAGNDVEAERLGWEEAEEEAQRLEDQDNDEPWLRFPLSVV